MYDYIAYSYAALAGYLLDFHLISSQVLNSIILHAVVHSPVWISIFTFISEDAAYLYGLTVHQLQHISALGLICYFSLGVFLGDMALYAIGYGLARFQSISFIARIRHKLFAKKLKPEFPGQQQPPRQKKFLGRFEQFLLFTRCLPGSRTPTYIYCGFTGYPIGKFAFLLTLSSLIYISLGILISKLIGNFVADLHWTLFILIAFTAFLITFTSLRLSFSCLSHRERFGKIWPFLYIKIVRLKRLEFWPAKLMYLRIVPFFIYLLLRYKGFSCALAANPAIRMSGFIGEKKSDIDILLQKSLSQHRLITVPVPLEVLETDQALLPEKLQSFLTEHQLKFPLVVKPEIGLKGFQVRLCGTMEDLVIALRSINGLAIVQEICAEPWEWGVFYYRFPGQKKGHILSVTHKIFPEVTGDGQTSLQALVMQNPEYRLRYECLLSERYEENQIVLAKGEKRRLIFQGNHAKGCLFRDGAAYLTSKMRAVLLDSFDQLEGFYIGRADIRFASLAALADGYFKIIELNGAGGESTNIYDPAMPVSRVYQILRKQWQLVFSIGYVNKSKGFVPETLWSFFIACWNFAKAKP